MGEDRANMTVGFCQEPQGGALYWIISKSQSNPASHEFIRIDDPGQFRTIMLRAAALDVVADMALAFDAAQLPVWNAWSLPEQIAVIGLLRAIATGAVF